VDIGYGMRPVNAEQYSDPAEHDTCVKETKNSMCSTSPRSHRASAAQPGEAVKQTDRLAAGDRHWLIGLRGIQERR
jgi:hypothetical protein